MYLARNTRFALFAALTVSLSSICIYIYARRNETPPSYHVAESAATYVAHRGSGVWQIRPGGTWECLEVLDQATRNATVVAASDDNSSFYFSLGNGRHTIVVALGQRCNVFTFESPGKFSRFISANRLLWQHGDSWKVLSSDGRVVEKPSGRWKSLDMSPNGRWVAVREDGCIQIMGDSNATIVAHRYEHVRWIAEASDSLAAQAVDGDVHIIKDGRVVRVLDGHLYGVLEVGGLVLVHTVANSSSVLYDATDGRDIRKLVELHGVRVFSMSKSGRVAMGWDSTSRYIPGLLVPISARRVLIELSDDWAHFRIREVEWGGVVFESP